MAHGIISALMRVADQDDHSAAKKLFIPNIEEPISHLVVKAGT